MKCVIARILFLPVYASKKTTKKQTSRKVLIQLVNSQELKHTVQLRPHQEAE